MTVSVEAALPRWLEEWPVSFPTLHGLWTVTNGDSWATVDPGTGVVSPVEVAEDPELFDLREALSEGTLISYRHRRRAVVKDRVGYIKVLRPNKRNVVARNHQVMVELAAESQTLCVPQVGPGLGRGSIRLTTVRGTSVHDLLKAGHDVDMDCLADVVHSLHQLSTDRLGPMRSGDEVARWIAVVGLAEPSAAEVFAEWSTMLPGLPANRIGGVVVHGDLHDKNVFLHADGGACIDLDTVGVGLRESDVANLAVHLHLRALQAGDSFASGGAAKEALYDSYQRHSRLDRDVLAVYEAHTWFRLAALYRFRAHSRRLASDLLDHRLLFSGR